MPGSGNPTMRAREWALLLALSVLWGGSFFFSKIAVSTLPPLVIALARVAVAAAVLVAVLHPSGGRLPRGWRIWRALFVMGLLNNAIPFALFLWAQTQIPSGLAAILNGTTPLFGVVVAGAVGQERLTLARLSGIGLGALGVAAMVGPGLVGGLGAHTVAEIACLAAALSYALAGVFGRRHLATLPPLTTATGQLMASAVLLTPLVACTVPDLGAFNPDRGAIMAVVGLAVVSTALAYVIYFRILAAAGSTNLLLVTQLIPVSAILLGAVFLGERLEARHFAGMAIIALGFAAIDGRVLRFFRRRAAL
jgi:drug/metabolite transporter (DMT)-like permease